MEYVFSDPLYFTPAMTDFFFPWQILSTKNLGDFCFPSVNLTNFLLVFLKRFTKFLTLPFLKIEILAVILVNEAEDE